MKIPTSDGCTWSVGDWIFFHKNLFGKRGCASQLFLVVHAYENLNKQDELWILLFFPVYMT